MTLPSYCYVQPAALCTFGPEYEQEWGKYEHQSSPDGRIRSAGRGGDSSGHSQRATRTTSTTNGHTRFGALGCAWRHARGGGPGNGTELLGKLSVAAEWSSRNNPNLDGPDRRASRPVILPALTPFLAGHW